MFKLLVLSALVACAFGATIPSGMLPQLDGRIVGGTDTTITSYPYIVSIMRSNSHSCGGSLISTTVVLSAAHCAQASASLFSVRAGSTNWSSGGTKVAVSKVLSHPSYNANTMVNDVALFYLAAPVTLGTNIQLIKLVDSAPSDGTSATVSGWGVKSYGSSTVSSTLQYVKVNIVSLSTCSSGSYSYGTQIKATMICASASGKDACQGDSGGPLVVTAGQAGIVSWGYGCAQANYPGVYSDVAALKSWIVANA